MRSWLRECMPSRNVGVRPSSGIELAAERELQDLLREASDLGVKIRALIVAGVAGNAATALRMLVPLGAHRARTAGAWLVVLGLTGLSLVLGQRCGRRRIAVHTRISELLRR